MPKILSIATVFFLTSVVAHAQKVEIKTKLSPVGSFTIEGTSLRGKVYKNGEIYSGQNLVLDLRPLKTGMELRDKHVQEYFETNKYPTATLLIGSGAKNKFKGQLKLRNITKPIEGNYEISGTTGTANFKVKMSDFGIKKANYMGLGVEDSVAVTVSMPITVGAPAAPVRPVTPARPAVPVTTRKQNVNKQKL